VRASRLARRAFGRTAQQMSRAHHADGRARRERGGNMESVGKGGKREPRGRPASTAARRLAGDSRFRGAVASLDAEDIALARLQAHLRRTEAIHAAPSAGATVLRRTTVRLPAVLLTRLRERAKRDGVTPSQVVEEALERLLRSR
jgi:hypothetical protein